MRLVGRMARFVLMIDVVLTARIILFGLVLAQLTDALTFTIGVSRFGIDLESNGLAAWLYTAPGSTACSSPRASCC